MGPPPPARRRHNTAALLGVLGLLGLEPRLAAAHVDLALLPCDAHDETQLWSMPAKGMGHGGCQLTHQASKLCLMARGCEAAEGTPLELGDCASGCAAPSDAKAAEFTLHHPGGTKPRALEIGAKPAEASAEDLLVVGASSSEPILTLMAWDAASPTHEEWTTALPYIGPGHTLQVGKGKDGSALCAAEPCCLGAHTDVVPDGDGGWVLIVAALAVGLVYVVGGVYLGRQRTGRITHLHIEQGRQIWGLVQDGCAFTLAVSRGGGVAAARRPGGGGQAVGSGGGSAGGPNAAAAVGSGKGGGAGGSSRLGLAPQATRGQGAGPLHHAASVGDATKLQALLAAMAMAEGGGQPKIDAGDHRQYTAFTAACAGGHAECVSLLMEAGCNTELACDVGLTGWELAEQLKRHNVLALKPAAGGGGGGGGGGSIASTSSRSSSSSSSRAQGKKAHKKSSRSSKRSGSSSNSSRSRGGGGDRDGGRMAPLLPASDASKAQTVVL
jgi:hypothetical protein